MRLSDLPIVQSVDERDIDFVLLEEFHSDPSFVTWFVKRTAGSNIENVEFVGAGHSVSDPRLGESDIILPVRANDVQKAI